jgi:D-inositol-3-phosphate glycosyltransferase
MKKRLLWVGDAACPSGFARSTHGVLEVLRETYDVTVLGINYRGDPHKYPYPIYAAVPGGDVMGYGRLIWLCDVIKPEVIVLQNDPWNIPGYTIRLKRTEIKDYAKVPVIGFLAVDGQNCKGAGMNDLDLGIFWTEFGSEEAKRGGFEKPRAVVPLGVDLANYYQVDCVPARRRLGLPAQFDDAFIVGNVNRNQPRKRLDLTIRYFAKWIKNYNVTDAWLYLHVAPTGDTTGYDCAQLAMYYGIGDRIVLNAPPAFYGHSEEYMRDTYNIMNAQITTTQGEGFGLTTFEGAACGVLQIIPKWAALDEFFGHGAAYDIPCTSTACTDSTINVIGGVMDEAKAIEALAMVYEQRNALRKLWSIRTASVGVLLASRSATQ